MAVMLKQPGAFTITPHKVSLCILLKIYAPPGQVSVPFPFESVAQHNRLGLFILALTKVSSISSPIVIPLYSMFCSTGVSGVWHLSVSHTDASPIHVISLNYILLSNDYHYGCVSCGVGVVSELALHPNRHVDPDNLKI